MRTLAVSVSGADDSKWAAEFMMALSSAHKFDTTIMFAEDEEVDNIQKMVAKIREVDSDKADQIEEAYSD